MKILSLWFFLFTAWVHAQSISFEVQHETITLNGTLEKAELDTLKQRLRWVQDAFIDLIPETLGKKYEISHVFIGIAPDFEAWKAFIETPGNRIPPAYINRRAFYNEATTTIYTYIIQRPEEEEISYLDAIVHEYVHHLSWSLFKIGYGTFYQKFYSEGIELTWVYEGLTEYLVSVDESGFKLSELKKEQLRRFINGSQYGAGIHYIVNHSDHWVYKYAPLFIAYLKAKKPEALKSIIENLYSMNPRLFWEETRAFLNATAETDFQTYLKSILDKP